MIKIAILGMGIVGSGAFETAEAVPEIKVKKILGRNMKSGYEEYMTTDYNEILYDDEIETVAECIGGVHPALEYVRAAMDNGKNVVTSNKALVSKYYRELSQCAKNNNVQFRFTSSTGGGIPWLSNLTRTKRCDEILEIYGIVNGTCNYILDNMYKDYMAFDEILKKAQSLGYAESNPSADIEGLDTARKCVISSNIAFDTVISETDIPVIGINTINLDDISFLKSKNLFCKLMMHSGLKNGKLFAYVEPVLFRPSCLEHNVPDNYNLITLEGKNIGKQSFFGEGAGKMPTGQSVIQDILDIDETKPLFRSTEKTIPFDNSVISHRYYLRMSQGYHNFPYELIETQHEIENNYYFRTKPISVAKAHSLAEEMMTFDESLFIASIKE